MFIIIGNYIINLILGVVGSGFVVVFVIWIGWMRNNCMFVRICFLVMFFWILK